MERCSSPGRAAACLVAAAGLTLIGCVPRQDHEISACLDESLRPLSLAAGDLDGDDQVDLAVGCSFANGPASSASGRVEVLLGESGDFAGPEVVHELEYGVTGVVLRDLTGDGRPELLANVSGSHQRFMVVLQRDGTGAFREIARATTRFTMSAPALVDLDDDGDLDVVMPRDNLQFRNDGDPTRPGPFVESRFVPMNEQNRVSLADVDGDGHADAVHLVARAGKIRLHATAAGTPAEVVLGKDVRRIRQVMAGADVNGDGRVELLAAAHSEADEGPWLMARSGADGWRVAPVLEGLKRGPGLHLGDLNGDGLNDLLAEPDARPDDSDHRLWVAHGRGDGTFEAGEVWATASFPYRPALVDVNGDGRRDVLYLDLQGEVIRLLSSS